MKPGCVNFQLFIFISISSIVFFIGCDNLELHSKWLNHDITIDGNDADWKNATTYIENAKIAIGLFNDENYLYLSLSPWDRKIQNQIMRRGCTLWFDPERDNKKTFGIRFPLGKKEMGLPLMDRGNRRESEKRLEMYKELQNELEILYTGEDEPTKMSISNAALYGINVMVGNSGGRLFYELKVPLKKDNQHPYAICADINKSIRIGFETPEIDTDIEIKKDNDNKPVGLLSGTGMIRRRRTSSEDSGIPRGSGGISERFELWTIVILSSKPSDER